MVDRTVELQQEIERLERVLREKEQELARMRRSAPAEFVGDFILRGEEGRAVALSGLFGDRDDLVVIHNMGSRCPYCTLWADGFNGVLHHLEDRTAFAVVSPDPRSSSSAANISSSANAVSSARGSSGLQ